MTKFFEEPRDWRGGTAVVVYETQALTDRARFATELIARFALIAGDANGEDSAGRQRIRLLTPEEIVKRACEISSAAFAEFEKREWVIALPDPKPAPERPRAEKAAAQRDTQLHFPNPKRSDDNANGMHHNENH